MYFSYPEDTRIGDHAHASSMCYERYLKLSRYPGKYVEIPYEDSFLPGHFYRSPVAADSAPLLVITPGRDTWADDTCWVYDAALRRGIHCLVYDGPGQGFALRLNNLRFRPDWENVVGPVIDFALQIPGIDPARIGLMGLSFGAFLSTRAAAFEKRLKVCIADPGSLNWGESIVNHFPPPIRKALVGEGPDFIRQAFTWTAEHTALSWLIRDYAWKHGVSNEDVFKALLAYDNTSVVGQIECETLVMDGTEEIARGQAQRLFDALKCPKHYMLFDEASTAQLHCQMGAYATASEYLFNWIEEKL
jgi:pimeloyl-ACP methyl ester carboxylesterase